MDQIIFENYAVAFLDILGFTDFIVKAEDPNSKEFKEFTTLQDVIKSALEFTRNDAQKQHLFPEDVELKCIYISDSFILSAPVRSQNYPGFSGLVAVSIKAIQLAHQLLKMGFLIRGGVAVGNVYRTDSNIFGTGYQDAYKTQCELARHPRIILHKGAEVELKNGRHLGLEMVRLSIFMREGNEIILDTLNTHWSYVGSERDCNLFKIYSEYKTKIEENLLKLPHGGKREKWEWFAKLFNAKLQDSSDLGGICRIEVDELFPFVFGLGNDSGQTTFKEAFSPFMQAPKHVKICAPETPGSQKQIGS
jgi:hypothetical protein